MYQIDENIPLPTIARSGRSSIYPWYDMEVGDSFFVSGLTSNRFSSAAASAARRTGHKYTVRTVTEQDEPGVRGWRIA